MTEAEAQDTRAKIENLNPGQIQEAYELLIMTGEFVVQMNQILLDNPPARDPYIDDDEVKRILTRLMHEAYVLDAIKQVTEGN